MKISTNWLKEYVPAIKDVKPEDLGNKFEMTTVEVDSVSRLQDGLKKIVVGHVLEVTKHPKSDHLHLCQVDVGQDEPIQIVCGAPNVVAGQKVIVALKNARIAGNVKIKQGRMRGERSEGMLCALQEIGFSDSVAPKKYEDGIYILPEDAVPGEPVYKYLGMDDAIIDLDLTPNRADLMSMRGAAYEAAALYKGQVELPHPENVENSQEKTSDYVSVQADKELAPAYKMRIIKNVHVKESPMWLQKRLWNMGIRPINNVVDVTNYVLLDYGQPLHSFDYDKLGSKNIVVRTAKEGEKFTTLDGNDRELKSRDILVTNGEKPVAIAGVMGGLESEVTADTTTVALESAVFNPHMVRKTSRREDLHTDAAVRFERGINVTTVQEALDQAAKMLAELADGEVLNGTVGYDETDKDPKQVKAGLKHINDVLGTSLTEDQVRDIFDRLGFACRFENGEFTVGVPKRRWDIFIDSDLIEEVARIYGYDKLPTKLPVAPTTPGHYTYKQKIVRDACQVLESSGLDQAISYSLTSEEKATRFLLEKGLTTKVQLPMNSDRTTLRMNLLSGLLDDLAYNAARKVNDAALYEEGIVFFRDEGNDRPREVEHIAGAMTGLFRQKNWNTKKQPVDFYLAKGIVEHLLNELGIESKISYEATQKFAEMHPGRTAMVLVDGDPVGFVGEIHPNLAKEYRLKRTYVFELDLDKIIAAKKDPEVYTPVPKYPAITRDIALLVSDDVSNADLMNCIKKNGGAYLQDVSLFDVYAGEHIKSGFKSMAYQLVYRNPKATLTEDQVNKAFDKVLLHLKDEFDVTVR